MGKASALRLSSKKRGIKNYPDPKTVGPKRTGPVDEPIAGQTEEGNSSSNGAQPKCTTGDEGNSSSNGAQPKCTTGGDAMSHIGVPNFDLVDIMLQRSSSGGSVQNMNTHDLLVKIYEAQEDMGRVLQGICEEQALMNAQIQSIKDQMAAGVNEKVESNEPVLDKRVFTNAVMPSMDPPMMVPEQHVYVGDGTLVNLQDVMSIISGTDTIQTKAMKLASLIYGDRVPTFWFKRKRGADGECFPNEGLLAITNLIKAGLLKECERAEINVDFVKSRLSRTIEKLRNKKK